MPGVTGRRLTDEALGGHRSRRQDRQKQNRQQDEEHDQSEQRSKAGIENEAQEESHKPDEHPETGDPQRGLITSGLVPGGPGGVNFMIEQPNRGKKSVGIDLANPDDAQQRVASALAADR